MAAATDAKLSPAGAVVGNHPSVVQLMETVKLLAVKNVTTGTSWQATDALRLAKSRLDGPVTPHNQVAVVSVVTL